MYDEPFTVGAGTDRDGFHAPAAIGGAIAGTDVEVHAPEAPRAMIAMAGAGCVEREFTAAVAAFEIFRCANVVARRGIAEGKMRHVRVEPWREYGSWPHPPKRSCGCARGGSGRVLVRPRQAPPRCQPRDMGVPLPANGVKARGPYSTLVFRDFIRGRITAHSQQRARGVRVRASMEGCAPAPDELPRGA